MFDGRNTDAMFVDEGRAKFCRTDVIAMGGNVANVRGHVRTVEYNATIRRCGMYCQRNGISAMQADTGTSYTVSNASLPEQIRQLGNFLHNSGDPSHRMLNDHVPVILYRFDQKAFF